MGQASPPALGLGAGCSMNPLASGVQNLGRLIAQPAVWSLPFSVPGSPGNNHRDSFLLCSASAPACPPVPAPAASCLLTSKPFYTGSFRGPGWQEPPCPVSLWLCRTRAQGRGPCGPPRPPVMSELAEPESGGQPSSGPVAEVGRCAQAWATCLPALPAHPGPAACCQHLPACLLEALQEPRAMYPSLRQPTIFLECPCDYVKPGQVQRRHGIIIWEQRSGVHDQEEVGTDDELGALRWPPPEVISPEAPGMPIAGTPPPHTTPGPALHWDSALRGWDLGWELFLHSVCPWAVLRGLCSLLKMYWIRKAQHAAARGLALAEEWAPVPGWILLWPWGTGAGREAPGK